MQISIINKESFDELLNELQTPKAIDREYFYELYETVCEAIQDTFEKGNNLSFTPVNQVVLILYILNEYLFSIGNLKTKKEIDEFNLDDEKFGKIATMCADKYLTNEQLNYKSKSFLNRFNPNISTLELYLNFALRILNSLKINNRIDSLVKDMLVKAFNLSKCIVSLLIDGFETEAFSTWRTLHENECILICLLNNGEAIFDDYFKHITYALAYRGQISSKEETDKIFENIKGEMKEHDLKSKDMKKFIEYGYLFKIPNLALNVDFKLNFRDGVEKLSGLGIYSKMYETASEIAHSSPLLLYSRKEYFFNVVMLNLYETFFRLEKIFATLYTSMSNEETKENYKSIRNIYLKQLESIYKKLKESYEKL